MRFARQHREKKTERERARKWNTKCQWKYTFFMRWHIRNRDAERGQAGRGIWWAQPSIFSTRFELTFSISQCHFWKIDLWPIVWPARGRRRVGGGCQLGGQIEFGPAPATEQSQSFCKNLSSVRLCCCLCGSRGVEAFLYSIPSTPPTFHSLYFSLSLPLSLSLFTLHS